MPLLSTRGAGSGRGFGLFGGLNLLPFGSGTGGSVQTVQTDFKLHTFTGDGQFVWTAGKDPTYGNKVQFLLVAGGGAGGGNHGGGGGAGGYFYNTDYNHTLTSGTYPIVVGGGGAAVPSSIGASGTPTTFSSLSSTGGGYGNAGGSSGGADGGSGGGDGYACS
jgi:hypothetical protein